MSGRIADVLCGRCVAVLLVASGGCVVDDPLYLGPPGASTTESTETGPGSTTEGTSEEPVTSTTGPTGGTVSGTGSTGTGSTTAVDPTEGTTTGETTDGCLGWWDGAWGHRHRLVFDNGGQAEDLEAFTVLVTLDAASFDYAATKPDGTDLRFVDEDGSTALPYHIEHWDPAGTSQVWVRVPRIDAGSTTDHVWLYHGNDAAADVQDPAGSYDEHHAGVWHLHETSGSHVDSAAGIACAWIGGGTGTQDAVGRIDGANGFGGANGIDCGPGHIVDTDFHTITAWVRMTLSPGSDPEQSVVVLEDLGSPYSGPSIYVHRSNGAVGIWHDGGYIYAAGVQVVPDQWALVAVRGHRAPVGGSIDVSVDGNPWQSLVAGDTSDLVIVPAAPLAIGQWLGPGPGSNATGIIDEARISTVERSDAWIRAQYLAGSDMFVSDEGDQVDEGVCP